MGSNDTGLMAMVRRAAEAFRATSALPAGRLKSCGGEFLGEFSRAIVARRDTEQRWLNDLRQMKGMYEPTEKTKMKGRSEAFVKKTRSKVRSINARMMELVFPSAKPRTFEVKPTPEPRLSPKTMEALKAELAKAFEGQPVPPEALEKAVKTEATSAAKRMATRIDDQLAEIGFRKHVRAILNSGHLYGTGILKGPLVERRDRVGYAIDQEGKWVLEREQRHLPFVDAVPVWRWYPDMEATEVSQLRYAFEDHALTKSALLALAHNGGHSGFDGQIIREYVEANPTGRVDQRDYQNDLRTAGMRLDSPLRKDSYLYTVLERWGWIEHDHAVELGLLKEDAQDDGPVFGNVWMFPDGQIIKAIPAPIKGVEWIYHLYYFDKDESSIFGEGIPAVMRDDQTNINAATRALLDNAAVTAGPQFEVYKTLLAAGEDHTDIRSFRTWLREGGDPQYPAVRQIKTDAHMQELLGIIGLFDDNADESTAIPKFWYGENPTQGAAGTASGLSMLMSNSNIPLKDQVVIYDEGITESFVPALYRWNMQFSRDDAIKGDFDVVATGAASLVSKEVRGQMLAVFSASLQPEERAYVKWAEVVKQKAVANDIEDVVLTEEEAQQQANSPEGQQQQKIQQLMQQLDLERAGALVAELKAKTANILAEGERKAAETIVKRVEAVYSAMQAAGVAAQSPAIAPAGDSILQESGWKSAPDAAANQQQGGQAQPAGPVPAMAGPDQAAAGDPAAGMQAPSPHIGQQGGIETPAIGAQP